MKHFHFASIAVALGIATPALATDIYLPDPPPLVTLHDWSGWYFGGHAGYGEANFDGGRELLEGDFDDPPELASDFDLSGFAGGIHLGFNHQFNATTDGHSLVVGMEGDITFLDWNDTISLEDEDGFEGISGEVELLGSVRGRLGVAHGKALFYATGGLAFTDAAFSTFEDGEDSVGRVDLGGVGGVVGGGAEFVTDHGIIVRAEGLYYFFDEKQFIPIDPDGDEPSDRLGGAEEGDFGAFDDAFVIRLGLSVPLSNLN